jgi:Flp pilus assembly protein TadG
MTRAVPLCRALLLDRAAAASVEMALISPLFLILIFGAVDLGNYFMSEHVVVKAVRDGARFASRQGFAKFDCATNTPDGAMVDSVRNVTRTGQVANSGTPRLATWTDPTSITITMRCDATNTYQGIYRGRSAPVVQVSARVSYKSLFNHFGITTSTLYLNALSEATVMGL